MKGLFTKKQAKQIIADYKHLVGSVNYLDPYPLLKVGFIKASKEDDGTYNINIGVNSNQLEIPEFMGFSVSYRPLLIFLKLKNIPFDCEKYGFL